jgi:hypothetical protein
MWGNEQEKLNGHAELSIHLLFTFHPEIDWGEPIGNFSPISWKDFKEQFVPLAGDETPAIASGQCEVTEGVRGHHGEDKIPVVSPESFEAEVKVFFPPTSCTLNGAATGSWTDRVGIQMIGLLASEYSAPMAVTLRNDRGDDIDADLLELEVIDDDLPVALWKPAKHRGMADQPDPNGPQVIEDTPIGLRIRSKAPAERASHAVDKQNLAFDVDEGTDIRLQAPCRIARGTKRTEADVVASMTGNRPDRRVLAALGIDAYDVSFQPLKDTDLIGIPHLV